MGVSFQAVLLGWKPRGLSARLAPKGFCLVLREGDRRVSLRGHNEINGGGGGSSRSRQHLPRTCACAAQKWGKATQDTQKGGIKLYETANENQNENVNPQQTRVTPVLVDHTIFTQRALLGVVESPSHGACGGEVAVVEEAVKLDTEHVQLQVCLDDLRALRNTKK